MEKIEKISEIYISHQEVGRRPFPLLFLALVDERHKIHDYTVHEYVPCKNILMKKKLESRKKKCCFPESSQRPVDFLTYALRTAPRVTPVGWRLRKVD